MKWIQALGQHQNAKIRLFCFHYSGGSSAFFYSWLNKIPHTVDLLTVELPGRGSNLDESLLYDMQTVVSKLLEHMTDYLDKPFIFFGHSMGALLCFELAKALKFHDLALPLHLIISGCKAPQNMCNKKPIYHLSDQEFIQELKLYNGTPEEVLTNRDIIEFFLPIIRADMTITDKYKFIDNIPLHCNITAIGGREDTTVSEIDVEGWAQHTTLKFENYILPGGHFFIKTSLNQVLYIVNQIIEEHSKSLY